MSTKTKVASTKATLKHATKTATTSKKAAKYDASITRTKLRQFLTDNCFSGIFSITATTKSGQTRKFTGRLTAPHAYKPKGSKNVPDVASLGMLRMWDMTAKPAPGWRTVNLPEVTEVKANKKTYRVR